MAARLKVFVTTDGLTDYIVAATSKPKALEAWGSHQDLFKTGLAHQTEDAKLVEAATAQPGEVLRRPAGSRATLESLKPVRRKSERPTGPTKTQLRRLADAEARLAAADAAHADALAALDAKRVELEDRHAKSRAKLEAAVSAARSASGPR